MGILVWDFDGTLGYREGGWAGACVAVLEDTDPARAVTIDDVRPHLQSGYPWHTPEEAHTDVSTADEWWEMLYPRFSTAFEANGVSPDRARNLARQVRRTYVSSDWHVYDDTIPTLSRLAEEGWRHVVLSNHVPELPSILESLELRAHLEAIYVSAAIGYEKPHPEAFRPVLDDVGVDITVAESDQFPTDGDESEPDIWMIGDSYRADVAGARGVGLPGILVRDSHPEATYVCEDLSSIDDILDDPLASR